MLGGSDCEAIVAGFLHQPVNAFSSLAFIVAGVVVARTVLTVGGRFMAIALLLTGVGSVLYHGPMPSWAGIVHDGGIALIVVGLVGLAIWPRWHRGSGRRLATPVLLLAGAVMVMMLGRTGEPWCRPDSVVQAHAVWHVLAATGVAWVSLVLGRPTPS